MRISNYLQKSSVVALAMTALLTVSAAPALANGNQGGKTCETHTLSVHLIPGDPTAYNLVGELCWKGNKNNKPVQLLVHGATYNKDYWDFDSAGKKISYVDEAVKSGYVTFAYDRLGSGESDKPLGVLVNVDNSAYVNSQVVAALRNGDFGKSFNKVVQVGHSFGSLISVASASTYGDVDALVLTGFAHQATEQANTGTQNSVYPAAFDAKFAGVVTDETYFTTIPGTRAGLFFNADATEAEVLVADEAEKDVMSLGLVFDIPRHFSTESLAIDVPVYLIMGSDDYMYCGENVDCSDNASFQAYEEGFFSGSVDTDIVKDLGHSLNLHEKSQKAFKKINHWVKKNV